MTTYAKTAADGSYSFTVNTPGDYTVTASKQFFNFSPQTQTIFVTGDRKVDFAGQLVNFKIRGQVQDDNGVGRGGVVVSLGQSQTVTQPDGTFIFQNLPALSTYTVTPSRSAVFGYTSRTVTLTGDASLVFKATRALRSRSMAS